MRRLSYWLICWRHCEISSDALLKNVLRNLAKCRIGDDSKVFGVETITL